MPDFPAIERKILRFWDDGRIFEKLRKQTANGPRWSFLDGPITANNPMGVHHAWGRSLKDMYQRYHAMNGEALRYQNGFDCQGLWVEVEVEKGLGLGTKRQIHEYGIERFVRACKERVLTYAARQTEQSIRLGYWCDWDDPRVLLALRDALEDEDRVITVKLPSGRTETARASEIIRKLGSAEYGGSYFTFSDENNYTIWSFLKKCHDEGFIYRGHDVMPWCGRCGTGLSQMEVVEGRRITTHTSVFVRFPVVGQEKTALLVWTTTPWTLTSNVAVAVNPGMAYLKVQHGEWTYYVAKANFERDRVQVLQAEGKHETHKLPSIRTILRGTGTVKELEELPAPPCSGSGTQGRSTICRLRRTGAEYFLTATLVTERHLSNRTALSNGMQSARTKGRGWSTSLPAAGPRINNSAKITSCPLSRLSTKVGFSRRASGSSPDETRMK